MPVINLIHPSRGRPQKAYTTYKKWMENAGHSELFVQHTISLDSDDTKVAEYRNWFKGTKTTIIVDQNSCVVEATNKAITVGDIFIYLSDDFDCPVGWAPSIFNEFKDLSPKLLKVDDCLQPFRVPVLTIPIMNRALYEKLGYFWNPLYKSMFVDEDLYWTCHKLNCIKYAPHLKFPHNHVSVGKAQDDETYRRSAANWNQGKEVFARRKAAGFPL